MALQLHTVRFGLMRIGSVFRCRTKSQCRLGFGFPLVETSKHTQNVSNSNK